MKVSGNRHGRYPALRAPHRTAEPYNVAFSFGWVERKLVREAPCFLGPVMRCQGRFNELCNRRWHKSTAFGSEKSTSKAVFARSEISSNSEGISKNP